MHYIVFLSTFSAMVKEVHKLTTFYVMTGVNYVGGLGGANDGMSGSQVDHLLRMFPPRKLKEIPGYEAPTIALAGSSAQLIAAPPNVLQELKTGAGTVSAEGLGKGGSELRNLVSRLTLYQ